MISRGWIVLFTAIALVPLVVFSVITIQANSRIHEARITSDRISLAKAAAQAVSAYVEGNLSTVRALALAPVVASADPAGTVPLFLLDVLADNPDWDGIGLIDPQGNTLTGSLNTSGTVNLADRDYFQGAAAGKPTVSEPLIGRIRGVVTVVLAAPVEFEGGQRGALVVPLSLTRLEEEIRELTGGQDVRIILVDGRSRAFLHPDSSVARQLPSLAGATEVDAVRRGETGTRITSSPDGIQQLAAYAPVSCCAWGVLAYEPTERAFAPARNAFMGQIGLLGLAVAMMATSAWFLGGRLAESYRATIQARLQAEEARALAERAVRSRDEYFAAASHDLRNPLTAIMGAAQMLSRRFESVDLEDADRLRNRTAIIESAANRMARLIAGLLDLARLEAGRSLDLDLASVDLVALTRRLVAEAQLTSDRHQIQVEAEGSLVGEWDPNRLERAVVNLLDNAVKYSPDGGEIRVQIRQEERDGQLTAVLTVEDQGVGIPAADLPHVFEQFRRGSNVSGNISGTGLGLAGVRQVVDEHGGTIGIESELGRGTRVTITLPIDPGDDPDDDGESDSESLIDQVTSEDGSAAGRR